MRLIVALLILGFSFGASSESISFDDYRQNGVQQGQEVHLLTGKNGARRIYVTLPFETILTPESDPALPLDEESINSQQGRFTRVHLKDLISSHQEHKIKEGVHEIEVFIHLHWVGTPYQKEGYGLKPDLEDTYVIQGELFRSTGGNEPYNFRLVAIPDLTIFGGILMGAGNLPFMFGRDPESESEILVREAETWTTYVLEPVLEQYFNKLLFKDAHPNDDASLKRD